MFSTLFSTVSPYITSVIGMGKDYIGKGWDLTKAGGSWLSDNLDGVGSLVGGLGGIGSSLFGSKSSSKKQYEYQSLLQQQAYQLQKRGYLEFPTAQRLGLQAAGYNPMLALGGLGSATYSGGSGSAGMATPDIAGSAKALGSLVKDIVGMAKAQKANIEADTKLKEGQLSAVDTQRLQTEANIALLNSQTERSDLAYGRDIADTALAIAGTGASLYSAKAMSDVAKANAVVNARNATVHERMLDTGTTEIRYDNKGKRVGSVERMTFSHGTPTVSSSANGASPNAEALLGSSAKSSGSFAKQVAKELLLESVIGVLGAGAGSLAADNLKRDIESGNHWDPKDRKNRKEKARRKWTLYHDIGF